ncbi:hypothetical protein ACFW04_011637 [Cataglyphis niger]
MEIIFNDRSKLLLVVVYRLPNSGYLNKFFQSFLDFQVDCWHSIILGNFNTNMNQNNSQQLDSFIFESSLYLVPFMSSELQHALKEFGQRGVAFLSAHDLSFIRNLPASWLTDAIRMVMRDRDLARRTWRKHKNDVFYDRYKMLPNKAQNLVRSAKRELRHLGFIKARDTGERLSHSVEELNAFFGHNAEHADYIKNDSSRDMFVRDFDDRSFHWNYIVISLKLLKLTIHCTTLPILEHLFNFSLMNGVFPVKWKSAVICPILKIRNPTLVQYYRSISILPTLSKTLKRLVCAQIRVYLEDSGLYDPCQSAYRNNHSTQTCLIRMLDEAFDRVDPFLLIEKLKNLNFSESILRWIHSYFTERTQAVKDWLGYRNALGPLLFALLADFSHVVKHCKYNFYD